MEIISDQITEEQCTKWSENPDSFVEDEDEDTFAYSVRISSQDLLMALSEEFEQECCASLAQVDYVLLLFRILCIFNPFYIQAIERHVREAAVARSQGKEEWWKGFFNMLSQSQQCTFLYEE